VRQDPAFLKPMIADLKASLGAVPPGRHKPGG